MKKYLSILLIGIIFLFPIISYGADAQVAVDGTTVKVGEESVITVTYTGENIGRVSGILEYDTSVLSYVSGGSSEGDAGAVQLKRAGTGEPIVFQLKFKAVKEGSTSIKVNTYEAYDLDEQPMGTPAGEEDIQITTEKVTDPGEEAPVDNPEEDPGQENPMEGDDPAEDEKDDMSTLYFLIGGILLVLIIMIIALAVRKKSSSEK